jgi:hypothetical protein
MDDFVQLAQRIIAAGQQNAGVIFQQLIVNVLRGLLLLSRLRECTRVNNLRTLKCDGEARICALG